MELGGVPVLTELVRNHIAGTVDMCKAVEKGIPELSVHKVIHPPAVAHVQGKCDILRLAMEGRRMGNSDLLHML